MLISFVRRRKSSRDSWWSAFRAPWTRRKIRKKSCQQKLNCHTVVFIFDFTSSFAKGSLQVNLTFRANKSSPINLFSITCYLKAQALTCLSIASKHCLSRDTLVPMTSMTPCCPVSVLQLKMSACLCLIALLLMSLNVACAPLSRKSAEKQVWQASLHKI